ncbi:hypothetical protein M9458_000335, partial [Cirrhinus mrigala]
MQRTGQVPGEMQEEPDPESPHSAQTLHASQGRFQARISEQRQVKWPAANKKNEWHQSDEDVDQILQVTARGDADRRLHTMCSIIINIAAERFGVKEQCPFGGTAGPNRLEENNRQLRKELRLLRKQFRQASEEDKAALAELRNIVRSKLTTTRRAEWHRRRSKERARRCAEFIANPFILTRRLLGQKRSGRLTCTQDEIDKYLSTSYSDTVRDQDLGPCSMLISPPEPSVAFNLKDPTLREVQKVVKVARTNSAPGPSGVPYVVYKRRPKLLQRLWKITKVTWKRGK